jgi:cytochrome-b5 reductase
MSSAPAKQNEFLTEKYINGVYIPSGLLVVGCLIVKKEWVPYAVVLALVLGGYKIFSNSKEPNCLADMLSTCHSEQC